ncbi:MAG: sugar O-acetyltransferase [Lachnospiraceae bacterium]|nr:sugar O-acetyltransferase [Lachnospiraceae bacterium]
MTEKEKMLAGKLYDPSDDELATLRTRAHNLSQDYNKTYETEDDRRKEILDVLVPNRKEGVYLQGPIQFDYGIFTTIGENTYVNFNFTVLDCAPVSIGDNVFFGPNVSILTPLHPIRYEERNMFRKENGQMTDREYAKPITVESNCWIAGNVTICGGVTIGSGSVIGAGSVVTRDIPSGVVAAGVPCRVIREITDEDRLN